MDDDRIPDPDTRRVLHELHRQSADLASADEWVARTAIATELELADYDTNEHLVALKNADLAKDSGRMSGGWRPTNAGRRLAEHLQTSRASGRERYEYTMREILRRAVEDEDGDFTRDEWEAWDLHEAGLPQVTLRERETAMDALEQQECITSIHAHGANHVRCEVTAKGRMVPGRPDVSLTDALFGQRPSPTTYDQRVGIQTETFTNQGGVQTGDHTVQHVIITNDQRNLVIQHLDQVRKVLADPTLPTEVVDTVEESVNAIETAMDADEPRPTELRQLRDTALAAAVTAVGTEAGKQLLQLLVDLGGVLPLG